MICKNCNRENNDNANFCAFCGSELPKKTKSKLSLRKEEDEEKVFYFDPHEDDQGNMHQDFENYFDNSNKNKNNNGKNKKIIAFVSAIVVVLIGVFLISEMGIFDDDSEEPIASSEEKTQSEEVDNAQSEEKENNVQDEEANNVQSEERENNVQNDKPIENQNNKSTEDRDNSQDTSSKEASSTNTDDKYREVEKLPIKNTECSSILHDSTNKDYGSIRVLDGDFSTVWSEGVSGYGQGEWIRLDFDSIYTVKKIKIVNGLVNKKNGYYNNHRVKSLVLRFSDGSTQTVYLEDDNTGYQVVNIDPVDSAYVQFIIDSVYYGSKYDDTCIADIEVLGY